MDEIQKLEEQMMVAVHSPQWITFISWLDKEEKIITREVRKATPEGLINLQGKLQMIDQLKTLKENIKRDVELRKFTLKEENPDG